MSIIVDGRSLKFFIAITLFTLFVTKQLDQQSLGLIIKPATGAGSAVFNSDDYGYVSQKTNGINCITKQ